ncbi:YgiQ family radical SAM protein [Candidatus Harpocratesius sp.]
MISTTLPQQTNTSGPFFDVILISGEKWADHPHSGIGIIARVLENEGYTVGIIEKPDWRTTTSFLKLGLPRLFFGISSGSIDSMLQNYTPLKKKRAEDPYHPFQSNIPDRATIVYAQKLRQALKSTEEGRNRKIPIVLGGVEASLRRFSHYDYWDNKIRRSILFDAKADILVYGPGEFQIIQIANRISKKQKLIGIEGTSIIVSQKEKKKVEEETENLEVLPSHEEVCTDKFRFCDMQLIFSNSKNLLQKVDNRAVIQFRMHQYTTEELDRIYNLPFTYNIPSDFPELQMAKFSIITHRGCIGECNFCAIALHQGTKIISRSKESILSEIELMSHLSDFHGYISDLGGPSANMYGMDCSNRDSCLQHCINCPILDRTHQKALDLLKESRKIPGVKKVFVRSGVRYDMIMDHEEYMKELIIHHISGHLKIAPEHFSPRVYHLMNKDNSRFSEFFRKFHQLNPDPKQGLKYYFITAHPGSTMEDAQLLRNKICKLGEKNTESIQIFTPTPMSVSTCMYYTGLNPYTKESIYVPYTYREKKDQKNILFKDRSSSTIGTQFKSQINVKKRKKKKKTKR